MATTLKLGIIGSGGILKNAHMQGWSTSEEIELAAFCDVSESRAQALADEYGVARVFTDYRQLLAQPDIDLVDICTPNVYHSEIAIAALQAGKHVFCEKPDAINPYEAQRMAEAAMLSGKVLMTMRNNRFRPASQFLKRYMTAGYMGEVYTGRCGWLRRRGIPGQGGWFTTKAMSGGGPLIDLGVHSIDLAMWLMGNPKPVAVSGAAYTKFAGSTITDSPNSKYGSSVAGGTFDVEDLAAGFIRFDNGATLQLEFSWASNIEEEMNFLELRGTRAGFSLKNGELKLFTEIEGVLCDIHPKPGKLHSGHEQNIHHFVDVVLGRSEPIINPESGVDMIRILAAIYESAELGTEIRL